MAACNVPNVTHSGTNSRTSFRHPATLRPRRALEYGSRRSRGHWASPMHDKLSKTPFDQPNADGYCYPTYKSFCYAVRGSKGYRRSSTSGRHELVLFLITSVCANTVSIWLFLRFGLRSFCGFIIFILILLVVLGWFEYRKDHRRRLAFIRAVSCFTCGYTLLGQDPDDNGHLHCPECGDSVHVRAHRPPPRQYYEVDSLQNSRRDSRP